MRIFIITMDDPVETHEFVKYIIDQKRDTIIGLAVSKGDRLRIGKNRSKFVYVCSLVLIMGIPYFIENTFKTLQFRLKRMLYKIGIYSNPSIMKYASDLKIPVWEIETPNSQMFRDELIKLKPDLIINQSQSIINKKLLDIPSLGVINRHNALLPRNRGRLTPFWVLFRGEKETGVTIHFLTEEIDSGDIIIQERFEVSSDETFRSLVKKNYKMAPIAMIKALNILESGLFKPLNDNDEQSTYNTIPTFREALKYKLLQIKRKF